MKQVLYIGRTDKSGRFHHVHWKILLQWIGRICDNVLLYTLQNAQHIHSYFAASSEIIEEMSIDESMDYKTFRLRCKDNKMWETICSADFDFDFNFGITLIYFLNGEEYKAELAVDDDKNFVILDLNELEEQDLRNAIPAISENVDICFTHKEDINGLVEDDSWKPLGY